MGAIDYFDTKKTAVKILKDWRDQHWKLENAPQQISELNERLYSIKSTSSNPTPVQGGANRTEENLCVGIDKKELLQHGLEKANEFYLDVMPAWERLTDDERFCLTARFIDYAEGRGIQQIMERYCIERSEAYRRSDAALEHFSSILFWR